MLFERFNKTFLAHFLGVWEGRRVVGGLAWYISPPDSYEDLLAYPYRGVTYLVFVCAACAFFAR